MKIALVVEGGLDRSGQTRVVPALLWLLERLTRRHEVHAFALRHEARATTYSLAGATVHDLGGFRRRIGPGVLWSLPRLLRELRRHGPFDVVHGHLAGAPGALAVLAGRMLSTPAIVSIADGELVAIPEVGYGLGLNLRGRMLVAVALGGAMAVTAPTAFAAQPARARGIDVDVVPYGVDTDFFSPGDAPVGPPWRLVQVATLSPVKDQATFLQALRLVAERGRLFSVDLVGEDTLGGRLQRECARLGLAPRVRFHGFQPIDAVRTLLRRAHLNVQSSRYESAGVAVLEASACGVPTVGTRVGHVADWAPERAMAVEVGDSPALAAAIERLLLDQGLRREVGRRAREGVVQNHADDVVARWETVYERVGMRGGRRRG